MTPGMVVVAVVVAWAIAVWRGREGLAGTWRDAGSPDEISRREAAQLHPAGRGREQR